MGHLHPSHHSGLHTAAGDTTCPVVIDSQEPESCPVTSVAPPIESPTETVTMIVTICGILILLVVTAIVAIVIAVVVCCRKQSKHMQVCVNTTLYSTLNT